MPEKMTGKLPCVKVSAKFYRGVTYYGVLDIFEHSVRPFERDEVSDRGCNGADEEEEHETTALLMNAEFAIIVARLDWLLTSRSAL